MLFFNFLSYQWCYQEILNPYIKGISAISSDSLWNWLLILHIISIKNDVHIHYQQFRKLLALNFHQNRSLKKNNILANLRKNCCLLHVGKCSCPDISTIVSARKFWSKPEGVLKCYLVPKNRCSWKTLFSKEYFWAQNASRSASHLYNFLFWQAISRIFF